MSMMAAIFDEYTVPIFVGIILNIRSVLMVKPINRTVKPRTNIVHTHFFLEGNDGNKIWKIKGKISIQINLTNSEMNKSSIIKLVILFR